MLIQTDLHVNMSNKLNKTKNKKPNKTQWVELKKKRKKKKKKKKKKTGTVFSEIFRRWSKEDPHNRRCSSAVFSSTKETPKRNENNSS